MIATVYYDRNQFFQWQTKDDMLFICLCRFATVNWEISVLSLFWCFCNQSILAMSEIPIVSNFSIMFLEENIQDSLIFSLEVVLQKFCCLQYWVLIVLLWYKALFTCFLFFLFLLCFAFLWIWFAILVWSNNPVLLLQPKIVASKCLCPVQSYF